MRKSLLLLISCLLPFLFYGQDKNDDKTYLDTSLNFETRAEKLVDLMTLEEKISQLGNNSAGIPRLGIKPYEWWNECLHGVARAGIATVFPQAIGMAATFDLDMMSEVANVISDEARAKHHEAFRNNDFSRYKGLTFWSPNINIFRDPRWGRGHETYGEDPYLTGQMGIRFVKGLQGDHPKYLKLVATAKHYAVHNGPEPERHSFNAVPNARDLWETYLPAFYDLMVEGKAYSLMGAYNRVDGESASASWMLLEDILRDKWGFEGYVVSDCGSIRDIYAFHKIVNSPEEAAAIGVRRGCDLNCGAVYQQHLFEAVQQGLIDEGEIDLAVYRLMLARMKLGMFDPPEMVPFAQIPYEVNDCEKHDALALEMAQKTMTLLKNDGTLPLKKNKIRKIAVIGPNANSVVALRANYHGEASNPVTILDGIKNTVAKRTKVYYNEGCPIVEHEKDQNRHDVIESKYLSTTDENGKTVNGLKGEYFNGINFEGPPVVTKVDDQIRMFWMEGSPTSTQVAQGMLTDEQQVNSDYFSIRWTGKLKAPETGTWEIGFVSDDGVRLYLDGELIAEDWTVHDMMPTISKVDFEAGREYDIKLEYYEEMGDAGIWLVWKKVEEQKKVEKGPFEPSEEMLKEVAKADVAVFVGGLDANWEGEEMRGLKGIEGFNGGDRTKIELPESQLKTIRDMQATGTPVVFVLMAGSAISFDGLEENLPAILMAWYPGQRGGDAVADVLFGEYNPAGRLPVTFYTSTDELADFTDYNMQAGKGFTYRYYKGEPLYPFGHGLSFTNFEYSAIKVDKTTICNDDEFTITVNVKNVGDMDGEEVVQLYVKDVNSEMVMPNKQLKGFERVALKKGEEKTISFTLKAADDLKYYSARYKRYLVEPGDFEIQVGASSGDIRLKTIVSVE
ncbi:MAG: glycoside hydrolase family 3 C-terminal domain-containing protein [Prolixibacteraceae bacterium]|nr:glycoside hydrolase family 3 C-terminal domain-containing protein [Prolixibacteraceae bacterium]